MTDREGETMSITRELRSVTANRGVIRVEAYEPTVVISESERDDIADRIDKQIDGLMADNAALQARLDASILPPVDADGVLWTGDDYGKPFASPDGQTTKILTEVTPTWRLDGWGLINEDGVVYPADKCHHVAPDPPESIDDVRRTVGRGYTYRDHDVLCAIDRAYACGKRDGAGEQA